VSVRTEQRQIKVLNYRVCFCDTGEMMSANPDQRSPQFSSETKGSRKTLNKEIMTLNKGTNTVTGGLCKTRGTISVLKLNADVNMLKCSMTIDTLMCCPIIWHLLIMRK